MIVAARDGFVMEDALQRAERMYVSVNIHSDENQEKLGLLESLPDSCMASADALDKDMEVFLAEGVFSRNMLEGISRKLREYADGNLRETLGTDRDAMLVQVRKYWHCG